MPANLPPQYFEAEKRYREAKTPALKILALEEMLTIMPKHKGTDKLRASLRQKISKLKNKPHKKRSTGRKENPLGIEREGAGQVILVGVANVGKSSLVDYLTNASPEVGEFPHTTWKPLPGMMPFENIKIQLVDTPALNSEYNDPWVIELIRHTDVLVIMVDLHGDPFHQLEETLSILDKHNILDLEALKEKKEIPESKPYPLILANKNDTSEYDEIFDIFCELLDVPLQVINISAKTGYNSSKFAQIIFNLLDIIRVYSKAPGKEADFNSPFILPKNSTLLDFAAKIHRDFVRNLKCARIWGKKVFDGQLVQRSHVLEDGDVVEIRT